MIQIARESFSIVHFDSLLANSTPRAGVNVLPNPGFELGSFAAWATSTNWSAVASSSVTPNGVGNFVAQAASASKGQVSTLESTRVAVAGANDYIASLAFAAPDGSPKRASNLKVLVCWWNASPGGTKLREDTLWASPVKRKKGGLRYAQMRLTSPASATYVSFVIQNTYGSALTGAGYGVLADEPFLAGVVTTSNLSALEHWQYGAAGTRFEKLKFSWHHQMGCKRMLFRLRGPSEYLDWMLNTALGHHVETHYENDKRFGGMLWSMFGRVGGRDLGITLDSLANYIKVPYKNSYYIASDAESILRYGRKDLIADKSFETITDAQAYANYLLNESAFPRPSGEDGSGGDDDYLDVEVMGNFASLQWVTDLPPLWLGSIDTSAAAATLTRTVLGGKSLLDRFREDTPNDFISSDYSNVETTGVTITPLEGTARQTSQEILLDLIGRGTSSKRAIVAGVGADLRFFMRQRPTTLGYVRRQDIDGKASYYAPTGEEIPRPLVHPGEFVTAGSIVPSFAVVPGSDAAKDPANRYMLETEYDHEQNALTAQLHGKRRVGLDLARAVRKSGK